MYQAIFVFLPHLESASLRSAVDNCNKYNLKAQSQESMPRMKKLLSLS